MMYRMKKKYIAPAMDIVEIEAAEMLAVSSVGYTDKEANSNYEALTNNRRGSWGNLWRD